MKRNFLICLIVITICMSVTTLATAYEYILQDLSDEWYDGLTKESTDTVINLLDPGKARHWRLEVNGSSGEVKKVEVINVSDESLGTRIFTITFNPIRSLYLRNYWGANIDDVYAGVTWPPGLTVDMSQYNGISFWFKGADTKAKINITFFEEKGERWTFHPRGDLWGLSFVDDSTEWREIYIPFEELVHCLSQVSKAEINNEMDLPFSGIRWTIWGGTGGPSDVTYSVANIRLIKERPISVLSIYM